MLHFRYKVQTLTFLLAIFSVSFVCAEGWYQDDYIIDLLEEQKEQTQEKREESSQAISNIDVELNKQVDSSFDNTIDASQDINELGRDTGLFAKDSNITDEQFDNIAAFDQAKREPSSLKKFFSKLFSFTTWFGFGDSTDEQHVADSVDNKPDDLVKFIDAQALQTQGLSTNLQGVSVAQIDALIQEKPISEFSQSAQYEVRYLGPTNASRFIEEPDTPSYVNDAGIDVRANIAAQKNIALVNIEPDAKAIKQEYKIFAAADKNSIVDNVGVGETILVEDFSGAGIGLEKVTVTKKYFSALGVKCVELLLDQQQLKRECN